MVCAQKWCVLKNVVCSKMMCAQRILCAQKCCMLKNVVCSKMLCSKMLCAQKCRMLKNVVCSKMSYAQKGSSQKLYAQKWCMLKNIRDITDGETYASNGIQKKAREDVYASQLGS